MELTKEQTKEELRKKLGRQLTVSEVGDIELDFLDLNKKIERSGKGGRCL